MSLNRIVIIGAGQGGFQVAASLRQEKFDGEIVLIGDEPGLPYQRPPLSKAYMKDGAADRLNLRPATFFETNRITYLPESRARRIDREAQQVEMEDGTRQRYDHLVLATGARNARPPLAGLDLDGVAELRTLADAAHLREVLPGVGHAVIVGGGFIGLEFAAVARAAGTPVTVIEAGARLMARAVSPEISEHFLNAHREMGTDIRLEAMAEEIAAGPDGRASGVRLKSGEVIEGDLVLVATGVVPNVELAEEAGLVCDNGICVDAHLRTEDPHISALGDCAAFPGPDGARLRLESVQAATDGARHIARSLAGSEEPYDAVPWFWSDQGELKLQIAGLPMRADGFVGRAQDRPKALVFGFVQGSLVSVETVNVPAQHMAARKLLASGAAPGPEEIERAGWDLKALLAGK